MSGKLIVQNLKVFQSEFDKIMHSETIGYCFCGHLLEQVHVIEKKRNNLFLSFLD